MRSFPAEFIARKNKIANPNAWVWLIQVQMNKIADSGFFITNNNVCIEYSGIDYEPYPVTVGDLAEDLEGSLNKVSVKIQDVLSEFMAYLEPGNGLIGNQVKLMLINLEDPFTDSYQLDLLIDDVEASDREVTINCAYFNLQDIAFPELRYIKDFCRWQFTGPECKVDPSVPNLGETCTKSLTGTFGCEYWGDQEALAAFPRKHPARFGAFPSLPLGRIFEV